MFNSFLVIDKGDYSSRNSEVTLSGAVYFNVGSIVPIIVRNQGCIGIAKIVSITITETSTVVVYEPTKNISDESKKAYYNLYRNNIGQGSHSSDSYDQQDVVIPGAMGGSRSKNNESRSFFGNDREDRRSGSILDALDDDDDDDRSVTKWRRW